MHFQYLPYLWVLVASAAITAALGVYAWRRRDVPGAASFAFLMGVATVWALANGLEMAGTDLHTKLFWANVQYLAYTTGPLAWLALVLQYTGRGAWLTRRRLALLAIAPAITVGLAWTNEFHGLLRRNVHLDSAGPFPVVGKIFGPWFWVHAAFTYLLFAITLYVLLDALRRALPLYRAQILVLLSGILIPLLSNALYNFGLSPVPRHDVSPALMSLAGAIVAWGLFRYRLFDIVPVARATVIEGMSGGVVVLDAQHRIVDLNPAAQRLLGWTGAQVIGRPAAKAFAPWPEVIALYQDKAITHTELGIGPGGARRFYDLRISPLIGWRGQTAGQVIVFHDITEYKQAQAQLLQQQRAVAVLEERERLARELHDDLGQVLGYVNVQVQAIQEMLGEEQAAMAGAARLAQRAARAEARLARLAQITQGAQDDVREYIVNVKLAYLTEQGLIPALEHYLRRYSRNYGLQAELTISDELSAEAFEPIVEVQLLRIIQEALTNVRKHANARHVQIAFSRVDDKVQVVIEDDGRGFTPTPTLPHFTGEGEGHFGLAIMRERAEEVGGSLQVQSMPGRGTRVIVTVPL